MSTLTKKALHFTPHQLISQRVPKSKESATQEYYYYSEKENNFAEHLALLLLHSFHWP